jgi:Glycogen recognition site of AMP-activated protein kinase
VRDERDEMIDRIVDELKTLPPVPADATARVLARVDAARRGEGPSAYASQDDDDVIFFPTSTEEMRASPSGLGQPLRAVASTGELRAAGRFRRRFVVSLPAAIGYAMAATLAGFLIRGAVPRQPATVAVTEARTAQPNKTLGRVPVTPAAATRRDLQEAPVTVQFVLDARRAKSVAVVGDFNSWDGSATPLQRDSATGVWSALVNVHPGRHVYAFLVDGSVWTLDPNAPRTKDVDYGTDQSVMIVGAQ